MTFLHLLDIIFLLMAVVSWITAGEVRSKYYKKLIELDERIDILDERQEDMRVKSAIIESRQYYIIRLLTYLRASITISTNDK